MYKIINYAFSKRNMYFISNPNTFVFIETYHNYRLFKINENTNLHKGVGCLCFLVRWFQRQCIQTFIWAPDSEKAKKQNLASTGDEDTLPVRHSQTAESSETGAVVTGSTGGWGPGVGLGQSTGLAHVRAWLQSPALGNRKKWQTKL